MSFRRPAIDAVRPECRGRQHKRLKRGHVRPEVNLLCQILLRNAERGVEHPAALEEGRAKLGTDAERLDLRLETVEPVPHIRLKRARNLSDLVFAAADALYRKRTGFRSPQIRLKGDVAENHGRNIPSRGKRKLRQRHADLKRQRRAAELQAELLHRSGNSAGRKRDFRELEQSGNVNVVGKG